MTQPATAHLSVEERRQIRAQRNRESAEKSRIRRKQQTAELERSVGELRDQNSTLKTRFLGLEALVKDVEESVDLGEEEIMNEGATRGIRAIHESLAVIQECKQNCLRTFRETPHSPEIQLKMNTLTK